MKLSVIGYGNMASAIAKGLLKFNVLAPADISVSAFHYANLLDRVEGMGLHAYEENLACAKEGDMILIAVKPYLVSDVLLEIHQALPGKAVLCIAAGWNYERLAPLLPEGCGAICLMPNLCMEAGQGTLLYERDNSLSQEQKAWLVRLFSPISMLVPVTSAQMPAAMAISGCGPAFAALFVEALADGGVKNGLPRKTALELAQRVLSGTGALLEQNGLHPALLKDAVCSPGGTTIQGVSELEKNGFRYDVLAAVDASAGRK